MAKRFLTIWFPHFKADWLCRRQPALKNIPFVLSALQRGRKVITASNRWAKRQGVETGMAVADAKAIYPGLEVIEEFPGLAADALENLGKWMIRYTPTVVLSPPDGLVLDISGCARLWGGEELYLKNIINRLTAIGYTVKAGIADTIGSAWAVSRYCQEYGIIAPGDQVNALLKLPPEALRLESNTVERLHKLGLKTIQHFFQMPRATLRRRFGPHLLQRLDEATGTTDEIIEPIEIVEPYQQRLPCLEPILTATGIAIALQKLLDALCTRLEREQKGIRQASLKAYRVDGKIEEISIATSRASHNTTHLFKLFDLKLSTIEPALGIDLFVLDATGIEDVSTMQAQLWQIAGIDKSKLAELVDRLAGRLGIQQITRYLPAEHHWPQRAYRPASSLDEQPACAWPMDLPRPLYVLMSPEKIKVTAPMPDYPPMNFQYKGKLHKILRADTVERIEQEWWIQQGLPLDYYRVEDQDGGRYWIFREGYYTEGSSPNWFIHGFFA